jgi:hypothetical protein
LAEVDGLDGGGRREFGAVAEAVFAGGDEE